MNTQLALECFPLAAAVASRFAAARPSLRHDFDEAARDAVVRVIGMDAPEPIGPGYVAVACRNACKNVIRDRRRNRPMVLISGDLLDRFAAEPAPTSAHEILARLLACLDPADAEFASHMNDRGRGRLPHRRRSRVLAKLRKAADRLGLELE